jgi:type IV secretion system protein VirD4
LIMAVGKPHSDTVPNGLLLGWAGKSAERPEPVWDLSREGHLITIASTGAGKGVSCAIPALLTWRGPAIVVDPKGENYAVTANRRREMGHLVHRLDPFRIAGDDYGDSLNPMDLIDPSADDFEDNAAVVAKLCMQDHRTLSDPFWDERATAMIVAVICELFRVMRRQPTLKDVQDAIRGAPIDDHTELLLQARGIDVPKPSGISVKNVITTSEFSTERTRASIMATAQAHLGFLRSSAVHGCLAGSTITLDDVTAGAMQTIYLILPADKLVTHGKLLRLWIGVMLAAISRRRRAPEQPTLFLIDEAAQLGPMTELKAALTLMRSYGVRVWTFWQDLSQLKATYPHEWESIINNSSVQQFFGAKSPYSKASLKAFLGDALPSEGLPDAHQLIFDGGSTKVMRRPNYLLDPLLKGLAAPNPFHAQQR